MTKLRVRGTYYPEKVLFAAFYRVAVEGGMRREDLMRAISQR